MEIKGEPFAIKQREAEIRFGSFEEIEQKRMEFEANFESYNLTLGETIPEFEKSKRHEFQNAFHGVSLDISEEEARKIRDLDFVEEVYRNQMIEIALNDSVPLINADDVWNYNEGYTGEGVTIAVVDTGIDYTHSAFGSCTRAEF